MGKNIFVGNLSCVGWRRTVKRAFRSKGTVDSVTVMRDIDTGRSRGFAFVNMETEEDAQKAITELNAYSLEGRNLTVNEARPKPERRGGSRSRRSRRSASVALVARGSHFRRILHADSFSESQ